MVKKAGQSFVPARSGKGRNQHERKAPRRVAKPAPRVLAVDEALAQVQWTRATGWGDGRLRPGANQAPASGPDLVPQLSGRF
jgi:hypothetical protein